MNGLVTALGFLTRFPVPTARTYALGTAVPWFPLVGAVLGVCLAGVDLASRSALGRHVVLSSAIDVVALLFLTGGLHADGLMDTCDAVFSHATPQRRLEIMRDPRVGSFGVVGYVSVVVLKIAALDAVPDAGRVLVLVLGPTVGRWCLLAVAAAFPYARPGGSGEPLKQAARPWALAAAGVVPVGLAALAGWWGVTVLLAALVVSLGCGRWLMRVLPGLTGDCYGAVCEVSETIVFVVAALALRPSGA